jgi:hypothetical protein
VRGRMKKGSFHVCCFQGGPWTCDIWGKDGEQVELKKKEAIGSNTWKAQMTSPSSTSKFKPICWSKLPSGKWMRWKGKNGLGSGGHQLRIIIKNSWTFYSSLLN